MKNVFSYLRVSGKGQSDGDGPDRQRDSINKFSAVHSLCVKGEFSEVISGTIEGMERPEFANLILAIDCRRLNGEEILGIVVERMDRLARDLLVQEILLGECRKRNIQVFSSDGAFEDIASNAGDPGRKLIRQIFGAIAEFDKSQIVAKLRKARDRKRDKGERCEGAKPWGELPGEKELLKFIEITWNPESTWKYRVEMMNNNGLLNRFGKPWKSSNLRHLIQTQLPELYAENIRVGKGQT